MHKNFTCVTGVGMSLNAMKNAQLMNHECLLVYEQHRLDRHGGNLIFMKCTNLKTIWQ